MQEHTLAGRVIAVPETRELDVFAALLERRGATVLRCPLVAILDAPDPAPVLDWIRWFGSGACDDLILLTGEGLRRLLACIDKNEPALRADFVAQLARVRKITRGPKPARALRELGLKPDIAAESPTTAGIIASLSAQQLGGSQHRCSALRHRAQRSADRFPAARWRTRARGRTLHLCQQERRWRGERVTRSDVARRSRRDRIHERRTGRSLVRDRARSASARCARPHSRRCSGTCRRRCARATRSARGVDAARFVLHEAARERARSSIRREAATRTECRERGVLDECYEPS